MMSLPAYLLKELRGGGGALSEMMRKWFRRVSTEPSFKHAAVSRPRVLQHTPVLLGYRGVTR